MIGLNLVRFRKLAGMTQNDIANILQIKRQTYSAYERDVSVPDAYTLAKISDVYQVSVDRLLGRQEQNPSSCRIPVLGHIQAGYPNLSAEDVIDFEEISQELAETGEYFALSVSGNSMEPRICEGDIVIIRRQATISSGEIAVLRIKGDASTIKTVVLRGKSLVLIAMNKDYPPIIYTSKEVELYPVEILGKVIELRARL